MRYNRLGDSDLFVSEFCLGTMTYGQQNTAEQAHQQLDLAVDNGVPAQAETQGLSEIYLGKWLQGKPRDQFILSTKMIAPGRGLEWIREGHHSISPSTIAAAVEGSLKRLGTDYIDLYQIHWPDRYVPTFGQTAYDPNQDRDTVPILKQLDGFAKQIKAGKIRYLGLSNETPWGVFSFYRLATQMGLPKVISVQNAYSLINRTFEIGVLEVCHRGNVGLLAYSPLAFGLLTGKYLQASPADGRLNLFSGFGARYRKSQVDEAVRAYAQIAQDRGISLAQLALTFVRHQGFIASTIIGSTKLEQLQANLNSLEIILEPDLLDQIEEIHQRYPNPAP